MKTIENKRTKLCVYCWKVETTTSDLLCFKHREAYIGRRDEAHYLIDKALDAYFDWWNFRP